MPNTSDAGDVRVTRELRDALRDSADVTFSLSSEAPDDRMSAALRDIWRALWDVGLSTPSPTGDEETPSYVSDPLSAQRGIRKITVDFAHVARDERERSPDVVAGLLRRHGVTPAVLDTRHLTKDEYERHREASADQPDDDGQPRLFRL